MSKHTPGPWDFVPAGNRPEVLAIDAGCKILVCRIESLRPVHDARLIAAAPDLLEALQWAMKTGLLRYENRIAGQNDGWCDAVDKARAAIAKATGESNG